jgi:hypothetical protein
MYDCVYPRLSFKTLKLLPDNHKEEFPEHSSVFMVETLSVS